MSMIDEIIQAIGKRRREDKRMVVAIDGRSASGKTSLSLQLGQLLDASVIHMDHFFPRAEQRTEERRNEPGGNIDYERFLPEVLEPLSRGIPFAYRPFDCRTMRLTDPIEVRLTDIVIIEGAYACHPLFRAYYDLCIFLSVDPATQAARILRRNGASLAQMFARNWIPWEERYITFFRIPQHCDLVFNSQA